MCHDKMKRSLEKTVGPTDDDDDECKYIPLTENGSSWIRTFHYSDTAVFNQLWDLHPAERAKVMMFGKLTEIPRFQQTFGSKGYNFSGVSHDTVPITPLIQTFLDYANRVCAPYLESYNGKIFNMALLNWYENGHNHIGAHSDDEKQLAKNNNGETLVFSISFGATRTFRLHPKDEKDGENVDFELIHGDALLMGGLCQSEFKHSVPKIGGKKGSKVGKRISATCRIFK